MVKRYIDTLMIGVIIVCIGIFFRQTIFQNKLPVPTDTLVGMYHPWLDSIAKVYPSGLPFKNFLITDPIRQQIPWRKLAIESIKNLNFHPWNPFAFSGTPLLENVQSGLLYPLNILFLILSFSAAWTFLIIVQLILSGIFMYSFLRVSVLLKPLPSLFGSICFIFSGFSIVWLTWGTIVQTLLWLPLILLLFDLICRSKRKKYTILLSILLGLTLATQYFAGHSQVFLYSTITFLLYGIFRLTMGKKDIVLRKQKILLLFPGIILFILITSFHWIPFLSYLSTSSRVLSGSIFKDDGFFLPYQNLIQFIAPDFFGNPATLNYWGIWNYAEFCGYIGIAGFVFALFAYFSPRKHIAIFWTIITLIALIFSLPTPISYIPYTMHIPILSSLQPTRFIAIIDFGLCILAAIGFEHWMESYSKKQYSIVGFIMFMLFGILWYVVILNPFKISQDNLIVTSRNIVFPTVILIAIISICILRSILDLIFQKGKTFVGILSGCMVLGVSFFDVTRFGWKFTPFTDSSLFFPQTEIISYLQAQQKPFRIAALDDRIMPPNVNVYYGIESIMGYDPIYDARYETFIAALERGEPNITPPFGFKRIITPKNISSPLFRLLGVKYVLTLDDLQNAGFQKVFQEGQTRVYEYKFVLPRIYVIENIYFEKDEKKIFERLYSPSFTIGKDAILEEELSFKPSIPLQNEKAEITSYGNNYMNISATTNKPRLIAIGNLFSPGWKAFVDGKETHIYKTNYLYMGIVIPEGNHTIRIQYE